MMAARMYGMVCGLLFVWAGTVWGADTARITQLAGTVHTDLHRLVKERKMKIADAVTQQKAFLLRQAEVKEVKQLRGNNLMVHFKDGNELLMLLGEDRLGSADTITIAQAQQDVLKPVPQVIIPEREVNRDVLQRLLPCAPKSNKALIFDCLEDDANVVSPKIWTQVKSDLESLGYTVTTKLNNNANLANAALIDDGEYGVVLMRGHGGDMGGDFGFLVRPWYTSYPPANSGYTGTVRASAYNHAAGATQFGYIITGSFSSSYWNNKAFPSTIFFLESCHGADPGALPGMPTWTTNHGASVWLGWNESVSFNCGDNGTDLFFQKMKEQASVGDAVAAVYATGCRPPELVAFPNSRGRCQLAVWKSDPNETSVIDARDFKLIRLVSDGSRLYSTITFYGAPSFDEFFFYADTGGTAAAEVLVKCRPGSFDVYKQTSPGLFTNKVHSGTPSISGNSYSISVPWNTSYGTASQVKVWLYDMTGRDRLPDSGSVTLKK
ncbi:hypothetical protein [Pelobacter propionicus]|uniref:Uncharacterized protein n=1 Tax=Pelobacter propionicus (strain DSM 2379 / NBRC 103807 / OttBd1) TaxID=338966 RepID=A1AS56_PELPD|nr:hypothetical protein [Pelobacter propionicus]ABL00177.1 hypothetical protein Ppro_2572 [Pelobacter propionicus DSM 2379]